ncbi:MAG: hydroxymethylpyrimidine/phosphomethylpyrimidine kinase [Myxococcales bacterium]|nr:hydroxymethylpyrimidine/phosphomethylpyrimidine kinase [Myxococcales bacterium]
MRVRTALTVAGSDCGGGAGLQADLKTFLDRGVYGLSVVTAITAQNTRGVHAVGLVEPGLVRDQLRAVFDDFPIDAMKTGMLGDARIIDTLCDVLEGLTARPALVVDPVMLSKDGTSLLEPRALDALRRRLFPLATLVTPNLPEAAVLGPLEGDVLLKGGHGEGRWVIDRLTVGRQERTFRHRRVETRHTHGTGCTLSAAITAELAKGVELETACRRGVRYVAGLIRRGGGDLGGGAGPLVHGR